MKSDNFEKFLILIATDMTIEKTLKPFIKIIDENSLNKIKWSYIAEYNIFDTAYLAITLNRITFPIIQKLRKYHWILASQCILKDKIQLDEKRIISSDSGFFKYKLLNAVKHNHFLSNNIFVEGNLWKNLSIENKEKIQKFLEELKAKRKINCDLLSLSLKRFNECQVACAISEQAITYKRHYQLLRNGQNVIYALGNFKNILDFNVEDNCITFMLQDFNLINQSNLNKLEVIRKIKKLKTKNSVILDFGNEYIVLYEMIRKIIRESSCPWYLLK